MYVCVRMYIYIYIYIHIYDTTRDKRSSCCVIYRFNSDMGRVNVGASEVIFIATSYT